jgi:hypothetical protein
MLLRFGSHSEKEYILNMRGAVDGIVIGANLFKATPGATASFLVKINSKRSPIPFYVDPMTYIYGCDLDLIKTEKRDKQGKIVSKDYKPSYKEMAVEYGQPFSSALDEETPLTADCLSAVARCCSSIIDYQVNIVAGEFKADSEFRAYIDRAPKPAAVIPPYFHIDEEDWKRWLQLNIAIWQIALKKSGSFPVHCVLCAGSRLLENQAFKSDLLRSLPDKVEAVWLWFTGFDEYEAMPNALMQFRKLVEELHGRGMAVYNMHGGYYSMALSKYGMTGICHGVGYGEKRDIEPIMGGGVPPVRYYLPALHKQIGVPDVERCFSSLQIMQPEDFYEKICNCEVCMSVIRTDLKEDFRKFGRMHKARLDSKRESQTPAAAKRCRYHFLLNRIKEKKWLTGVTIDDVVSQLDEAHSIWSQTSLRSSELERIRFWHDALK